MRLRVHGNDVCKYFMNILFLVDKLFDHMRLRVYDNNVCKCFMEILCFLVCNSVFIKDIQYKRKIIFQNLSNSCIFI